MSEYRIYGSTLTNIAEAIRAKAGTSELMTPAQMATNITNIQTGGGGGGAVNRGVNFYDYDGTLLYSYTPSEAAALTELPPLPSHDGLVCQGWNWSLADIKDMGRDVNVGAMYTTEDGCTKLDIKVLDTAKYEFPLLCSSEGDISLYTDWGDGSTETINTTDLAQFTHQYAKTGDYEITLRVTAGVATAIGFYTEDSDEVYFSLVRRIFVAEDMPLSVFFDCRDMTYAVLSYGRTSIAEGAFYKCKNLTCVVIPSSVTELVYAVFSGCTSLTTVILPNGLDRINGDMFQGCKSLVNVTIPDSVTEIYYGAFSGCSSLTSITIPANVELISIAAFEECTGMKEYHFKSNTPPTLRGGAFEGIPDDCIIYVPKGCLSAYRSAENWSEYADYMKEEEA